MKEIDELEAEVAKQIHASIRADQAFEIIKNDPRPVPVAGERRPEKKLWHQDADDWLVVAMNQNELTSQIESAIAKTQAAYESKAITDRDNEYAALKRLEAMRDALAARDVGLLPEPTPRKKLPKQIRDRLPNMTPQEVVEAMKPYEPTGWDIITALQTQWPEMENYRAGAYANGLDPDDPDTRKAAENFYQRNKPRKGKKRE